MKFTTIFGVLIALIVVVYLIKPSLIWRAGDAISGLFVSKVKQVTKPVVKGKTEKSSRLQGIEQP